LVFIHTAFLPLSLFLPLSHSLTHTNSMRELENIFDGLDFAEWFLKHIFMYVNLYFGNSMYLCIQWSHAFIIEKLIGLGFGLDYMVYIKYLKFIISTMVCSKLYVVRSPFFVALFFLISSGSFSFVKLWICMNDYSPVSMW
jgi:hypothetical protein